VKLLYGFSLPSDELLKVSQTALESIISAEQAGGISSTTVPTLNLSSSLSRRSISSSYSSFHDAHSPLSKKRKLRTSTSGNSSPREGIGGAGGGKFKEYLDNDEMNGDYDEERSEEDEIEGAVDLSGMEDHHDLNTHLESSNQTPSTLGPYSADNQLEYLEDGFQVIAVLVRVNAARLKDDMRKEGTRMNAWDMGGEVKGGRRELQAKFSLLEKRMEKRLEATRAFVEAEGFDPSDADVDFRTTFATKRDRVDGVSESLKYSMPRLEIVATRLQLDAFEKRLILLLIGKTVSPVVKALMDTLDQGSGSPPPPPLPPRSVDHLLRSSS
jgi:hypothetical protein